MQTFEYQNQVWEVQSEKYYSPNFPNRQTIIASTKLNDDVIVEAFEEFDGKLEKLPVWTNPSKEFLLNEDLKAITKRVQESVLEESKMKDLVTDVHPLVGKLNLSMQRNTQAIHSKLPDGRLVVEFQKKEKKDAGKLAKHTEELGAIQHAYQKTPGEFAPRYFSVTYPKHVVDEHEAHG